MKPAEDTEYGSAAIVVVLLIAVSFTFVHAVLHDDVLLWALNAALSYPASRLVDDIIKEIS